MERLESSGLQFTEIIFLELGHFGGRVFTQDVDVIVWWRDVRQARLHRISAMTRQFLAIPAASATAELVFRNQVNNESLGAPFQRF